MIIFVYNANSGAMSTIMDIGHKILSPSTYSCNLCNLTHGVFTEREAWSNFKSEFGEQFSFLHKDEFEEKYPDINASYPVIFSKIDTEMKIILNSKELNTFNSVEELIKCIKKAL